MKKRILCLITAFVLVLVFLLPISAFADESANKYSLDNAALMNEGQVSSLEEKLKAFSESYDFDVVFLTVNTLDGKTPMEYADDYYDYNSYREDGCLFLVSMEDRDWWISTKGYGITAITDYGIRVIESEVVPYLSEGDYYGAAVTYSGIVKEFVDSARRGYPYDTNYTYTNPSGHTYSESSSDSDEETEAKRSAIIVSIVVALILAAIITLTVKSGYKPVRFKASAGDYLVDGSLNVTQSYEHFLYSNVSKTEIQSSSSSGGGSSTHSSSSGSSHGGGGGKF